MLNKHTKSRYEWLVLLGGMLLGSVCLGLWCHTDDDTRVGVLAPHPPMQQALDPPMADFEFRAHRLKPQASFLMQAQVLSMAWYAEGTGAMIAPLDLALGWGPMSDSVVLSHFQISQSLRWYALSAPKSPISMHTAAQHSANIHIIPANSGLQTYLQAVKVGDVVELSGWLVNVEGENWHINSSLTRDDRGAGACEVLYLLTFEVL